MPAKYRFASPLNVNLCGGESFVRQVEVIDAIHDWHEYFLPFNFEVHGIAIMESEESVNHAWRLIRREDLRHYMVNGSPYVWEISSALIRTHQSNFQYMGSLPLYGKSSHIWEDVPIYIYRKSSHTWEVFPCVHGLPSCLKTSLTSEHFPSLVRLPICGNTAQMLEDMLHMGRLRIHGTRMRLYQPTL